MLYTYDPKEVSIILAGQIASGYADGEFITVERDEDSFSLQVGSDGDATRSKSNNRSGTLTLRLRQGAPFNDVLSAMYQADELSGGGIFSALIKDNLGTSLHSAVSAWIQKPAAAAYGREADVREWVIRTDNLQTFIGGNNPAAV